MSTENDENVSDLETQPTNLKDRLVRNVDDHISATDEQLQKLYDEAKTQRPGAFDDNTPDDWFKYRQNPSHEMRQAEYLASRKERFSLAKEALQSHPAEVIELFFGGGVDDDRPDESRLAEYGKIFNGEDKILVSKGESGTVALMSRKGADSKKFPDAVTNRVYANPEQYIHIPLPNGNEIIQIKPRTRSETS